MKLTFARSQVLEVLKTLGGEVDIFDIRKAFNEIHGEDRTDSALRRILAILEENHYVKVRGLAHLFYTLTPKGKELASSIKPNKAEDITIPIDKLEHFIDEKIREAFKMSNMSFYSFCHFHNLDKRSMRSILDHKESFNRLKLFSKIYPNHQVSFN